MHTCSSSPLQAEAEDAKFEASLGNVDGSRLV